MDNPLYRISGTSIAIYVFPKGEALTGDDYLEFLEINDESRVAEKNNYDQNQNSIFVPNIDGATASKITSFDFVFSDYSGNTVNDLVELSAIKRSTLKEIMQRINAIHRSLKEKYARNYDIRIEQSYKNILGSAQRNSSGKVVYKRNKKYENHLLKVLPKIYSQNYYQDEILLPALIEKVEFTIRNGDKKDISWNYKDLKFHLEFLLGIQNHQKDKYMEITNSKSYQIGLLLGSLSKDLKNKINSFEKNYVGNLTRRISTLQDCIKFKNEIEEKNIMHDIAKYKHNISSELSEMIRNINESEYDKEHVAFGFFESYFKYESKKGFLGKLEKLISDYASNEEEKDVQLIERIIDVLKKYQTQ